MTRLLLAALVLCAGAAHAQPTEADITTYRAKLAEYVAKGATVDETLLGLRGWFGWPFLARYDQGNGTVDFLVKAPALGEEIRYLRTIGSVKLSEPRLLIESPQ